MDPITLLAVVGSVASVISLFNSSGTQITVNAVTAQVIEDSTIEVRDGAFIRQERAIDATDEEIRQVASDLIAGFSMNEQIIERVKFCTEPFVKASFAPDPEDFDEAYQVARRCVCNALKIARDGNGGRLPEVLKPYWRQFNCLNI